MSIVRLILGDCAYHLTTLPDNSVDSAVCDPPYELKFMNKGWDGTGIAYSVPMWKQVLRVLKPGGYLLAFGGTRTYHRMACAIEDAGFEIRDSLHWVYGVGMPKSLSIPKALAKGGYLCGCAPVSEHNMRSVRDSNVQTPVHVEGGQGSILLASMSEQSTPVAGRTQSPDHVWTGQPSVEGRRDVQTPQGELHRGEIREVSSGVRIDGAEGRVHSGASIGHSADDRETPKSNRSRSSPRSQSAQQRARESGTLRLKPGAQACGSCGKPRAEDLAHDGFGTALKPSHEPIVMAMKPIEGTFAKNVLKYGTGGLNIDACRIATTDNLNGGAYSGGARPTSMVGAEGEAGGTNSMFESGGGRLDPTAFKQPVGRWPSNVLFSHSEGCKLVGTKEVKATSVTNPEGIVRRGGAHADAKGYQSPGRVQPMNGYGDEHGKETVEAWECTEDCPVAELDRQSGVSQSAVREGGEGEHLDPSTEGWRFKRATGGFTDKGGASRFFKTFETEKSYQCIDPECQEAAETPYHGHPIETPRFMYVTKPSRKERDFGCDGLAEHDASTTINRDADSAGAQNARSGSNRGGAPIFTCSACDLNLGGGRAATKCPKTENGEHAKVQTGTYPKARNNHPTVKPVKLMQYLVRLVTPPGGTVLDPFMGSGSTGMAALKEGFDFIGIEKTPEYMEIAEARIEAVKRGEWFKAPEGKEQEESEDEAS